MKIKNYVIANVNSADALQLKDLIDPMSFLQSVGTTSTLEETIDVLSNQPVDFVFLDLDQSPKLALELLQYSINFPPVIITSNTPEYAVECYEIGKAIDYILKPFAYNRLFVAINRALGQKPDENIDFIFLKMGRKIQRFELESILYAEAYGVYTKIYCENNKYVINERLLELDKMLPSNMFTRVHKSYIINITKMSSYDKNSFYLGQEKIPIGISFRSKFDGLMGRFDNDVMPSNKITTLN